MTKDERRRMKTKRFEKNDEHERKVKELLSFKNGALRRLYAFRGVDNGILLSFLIQRLATRLEIAMPKLDKHSQWLHIPLETLKLDMKMKHIS